MQVIDNFRKYLGWCPQARQRYARPDFNAIPLNPVIKAVPPPGILPGPVSGKDFFYRHTAKTFIGGNTLNLAMVLTAVVSAIFVTRAGLPWLYVSPFVIALSYIVFQSLYATVTVAVSKNTVEFWFGRGIRRRNISLSAVAGCAVVKNPANFGWSIRASLFEWFYNVSGPDAVEILLGDGRKVLIGTDDPHMLAGVINNAIR